MPSERRLHPATLIFAAADSIRELLIPLVLVVLTTSGRGVAWLAAGLGTVLVLFAAWSLASYLRFTYRLEEREMVVRSGVLVRTERHIPYARIQHVDAVQNPVHRLFGVAVVNVQTGSGAEPEATLRVLGAPAMAELRERAESGAPPDAVEHGTDATEQAGTQAHLPAEPAASRATPAPAAVPLLHLDTGELLLRGLVENRGMVLILGGLAVLERSGLLERALERWEVPGAVRVAETLGAWSPGQAPGLATAALAVAVLLALLLVLRLISVVWAVVRLYDYRVTRTGDDLRIEYGLLTRVVATVPLRRIQLVKVERGIIHRLSGRAQVSVVTAGGGTGEAGTSRRELLAPMLRMEKLTAFLGVLQPGLELAGLEWHPVHPRAFRRMLLLRPHHFLGISALAILLIRAWAAPLIAVLLAHRILHARLRSRRLGWALGQGLLASRGGGLWQYVAVARFERIQALALHSSPFDRRTGMARLLVDTAGSGGGMGVPYLPAGEARTLHETLRHRVVQTPFTW